MAERSLAEILKKRRQISITVVGRRTGREITLPVWFASDEQALWLLPVYGSRTQWFRNLEKTPGISIHVGKNRHELQARLLTDAAATGSVIERFREKYTPEQIERWYTGLDVAVQVSFQSE